MSDRAGYLSSLPRDLAAGVVVFLVALPLCLGIALASGAPLLSGLVSGVVGGVVVVWVSGSHTSVTGPAAGLTAVVASQIAGLGSFEAFLVAVVLAGVIQIALAAIKAGSLAVFVPSNVIKGLLAAIGIILILKQVPHLFGHDPDWVGDMSFRQPDGESTLSELIVTMFDTHPGAMFIGIASILILVGWDKTPLKKSPIPAPLVVVIIGTGLAMLSKWYGGLWAVGPAHSVQVPVAASVGGMFGQLHSPDFSVISQSAVLIAAVTVAVVASLETLLNIEAVDKLDRYKRVTPPNRELFAQGVGNMTAGLLGGLPVTSVVVRGSVNVRSGGRTRMSCFTHGVLLLVMVVGLPGVLNQIPLSCLAAILMVTGFRLTSPVLYRQMWSEGLRQFLPFVVTIVAIVFTDLLVGVLIGMFVATLVILHSNLKNPLRKISERHVSGDVLRIEFSNQMGFLTRASLLRTLREAPSGSHLVLDARNTYYMDPDILDLILEFETETAPAHGVQLSLLGFKDHYDVEDRITYVDFSTREIQQEATPQQILQLLRDGNERFVTSQQIVRDPRRQVDVTATAQFPLAVVLACMDSRVATEMIFDLGLGDIFSVRLAGNIAEEEILGSLEYGCAVAGAKLLLVLGHTRCGAVSATIDLVVRGSTAVQATGCENLDTVVEPIARSVRAEMSEHAGSDTADEAFARRVSERNVHNSIADICARSPSLRKLVEQGDLLVAGGVYDVSSGRVQFLGDAGGDQPAR